MIYTINKSRNPFNGLNVHLRGLQKTGLTRHRIGFSYADEDLKHADLIILGNYTIEDIFSIRTNLPREVRIGYLFCSPLGQASCNGELQLLYQLIKLSEDRDGLDFLFFGDKGAYEVFKHNPRVGHLPAVSDFEGQFVLHTKREGILLLGNNLRTSRNFATQLGALKILQDEGLGRPINSYFMEKNAHDFYKNLFDLKNWTNNTQSLSDDEKLRAIAGSEFGMQITYSDGFNIAAYEHAMCHVPCFVSSSLWWTRKFNSNLAVKMIDNPSIMANQIANVITDRKWMAKLGDEFNERGKEAMSINLGVCDTTLRNCL